jgi:ABC-2 type transport system permease protein
MSLMEIPEQVRRGSLDFVVTKPVSSLFWVSVRRFDLGKLGSVLVGFILLVYGVWQTQAPISPLAVFLYGWTSLCGLALLYALALFLMTLAIFFTRVDNLWVLGETMVDVARFPVDVYPGTFRTLLVYAIPLGLIATIPAGLLVKGFGTDLALLSTIWAIAACCLATLFWKKSLMRYTSASS